MSAVDFREMLKATTDRPSLQGINTDLRGAPDADLAGSGCGKMLTKPLAAVLLRGFYKSDGWCRRA
jgi:hypothetical protein